MRLLPHSRKTCQKSDSNTNKRHHGALGLAAAQVHWLTHPIHRGGGGSAPQQHPRKSKARPRPHALPPCTH
eukprot:3317838-Prorocentrum_lima.AAC.1